MKSNTLKKQDQQPLAVEKKLDPAAVAHVSLNEVAVDPVIRVVTPEELKAIEDYPAMAIVGRRNLVAGTFMQATEHIKERSRLVEAVNALGAGASIKDLVKTFTPGSTTKISSQPELDALTKDVSASPEVVAEAMNHNLVPQFETIFANPSNKMLSPSTEETTAPLIALRLIRNITKNKSRRDPQSTELPVPTIMVGMDGSRYIGLESTDEVYVICEDTADRLGNHAYSFLTMEEDPADKGSVTIHNHPLTAEAARSLLTKIVNMEKVASA